MRIYWTDFFKTGNVAMFARPRGGEWLKDEITSLGNCGITTIICLLEYSEIIELGLEKEEEFCQNLKIEFIHFPIPDMNLPSDKKAFEQLVQKIIFKLEKNQKVGIHCRMGIGRTSVLAGSVLKRCQMPVQDIFDHLTNKRTLTVPDTREQIEWVMDF